jgi:hypothetical protein
MFTTRSWYARIDRIIDGVVDDLICAEDRTSSTAPSCRRL